MFSSGKGSSQRTNKVIRGRTLVLMLVCGIVAFSVLAGRLYKLMIVDHEFYTEKAVKQQTRSTAIAADRGAIYDRGGNVLAMSATAYNIFVSPYEVDHYYTSTAEEDQKYGDDPELIARELSGILDVSYDSIMEKLEDKSSWYKTLALKVENDVVEQVRDFKSKNNIVGVHIENTSKRYYPNGSLACHVIGFVGRDNFGLEGIEKLYNEYLEGTDGSVVRLTTSNGTEMLFENYENYNDATDGLNLDLTLDNGVQAIAEKYLQQAVAANSIQTGGCCIVMSVKTGEILALANANGYDLNDPWTLPQEKLDAINELEDEGERGEALAKAQYAQWRNMTLSDTYEPGSVFKILTMAIGVEEGVADESTRYSCSGIRDDIPGRDVPLRCWKRAGHGVQSLREAAMHSCNIAFSSIAMDVGADRYYDYIEAFGLKEPTQIDLLGEVKPLWWSRESFTAHGQLASLTSASFGQTFTVTPIQMITAVSACVNGGYLMEPYIVSRVTDSDGQITYSREPTVVRQVISEETSRTVCSILESVVCDEGGTGANAYVAGYRVGGKTGTTRKTALEVATGNVEYMVSFCGIAPMDDPEVAVLLVLDNPLPQSVTGIYVGGGQMAAPYVGKILGEVLPYLGVEPVYTPEELSRVDIRVTRLVNLPVDDARRMAADMGLTVRVVGTGDKVTSQLPSAGAKVAAGSQLILYAGEDRETRTVTVPDIHGLTFADARARLQSAGLFMNTSGALPTGKAIVVATQSIAAGEEIPFGAVVECTLVDKNNLGETSLYFE